MMLQLDSLCSSSYVINVDIFNYFTAYTRYTYNWFGLVYFISRSNWFICGFCTSLSSTSSMTVKKICLHLNLD